MNLVQVRLVEDNTLSGIAKIGDADDVAGFVSELLKGYDKEAFVVLNLNVKGKVINANIASIGTATETLVSPKEIFKTSILSNSSAIILAHNHPSGECLPSEEDIDTTKRILDSGKTLGIAILDHIIIGEAKYISFAEHGWMNELSTKSGLQNVKNEVNYLRGRSLATKKTPENTLYTGQGNFHILAESGDNYLLKSDNGLKIILGYDIGYGKGKIELDYPDTAEGLMNASEKFMMMTDSKRFVELQKASFRENLSYEDKFITVCEAENEEFRAFSDEMKSEMFNRFMNDDSVTGLIDMQAVWDAYDREEDRIAERSTDLGEALYGADGVMMFGSDEDKDHLMKEYEALTVVKEKDDFSFYGEKGEKMSKMNDFRTHVANAFLKNIEENPMQWKKPWMDEVTPRNAVTGRLYRGINSFYLNIVGYDRGYEDPRWATFKQIKENNWHLQKGSKGVDVEYWMPLQWDEKKENRVAISWKKFYELTSDEKEECIFTPKYFRVFNAECIDGIPPLELGNRTISPDELIDRIKAGMNIEVINDGGSRSFYSPSEDKIHLPRPEHFASDYDYDATALHELGHATGHSSRLNRDIENTFGTDEYAYEELVAELTSCFMSEHIAAPMSEEHMTNHMAYLQSWAESIKEDSSVLFSAIKDAQDASDYMEKAAGIDKYADISKESAETSIRVNADRIENENEKEGVVEGVRYYSVHNSLLRDNYPRTGNEKAINFDGRVYCEEIHMDAWGYVIYPEALDMETAEEYGLVQGGSEGRLVINQFDSGRKIAVINVQNDFEFQKENTAVKEKQAEQDTGAEV